MLLFKHCSSCLDKKALVTNLAFLGSLISKFCSVNTISVRERVCVKENKNLIQSSPQNH